RHLVGGLGHDEYVLADLALSRQVQYRQRVPGLGLSAIDETVDHLHEAVPGPVGKRAAQRCGLHLLRRLLGIGTRHGSVHDAAAGELRRPDRALPGPACTLLPVRLLATTAHVTAGLGGMRALPGRRLLRDHDLVDQRYVDAGIEDVVRQVGVYQAVAGNRRRSLRLGRWLLARG